MSALRLVRSCLDRFIIGLVASSFPLAAMAADPLDGWWASDGYGLLLEIRGDEIRASETTSISCVSSFVAVRQAAVPDGAEASLSITSMTPPVDILVKPGSSADHKWMLVKDKASAIGFRRISQPPAVCGKSQDQSPIHNFDVFWTTFNEHYPFFQLREVDWEQVRENYRPRVSSETTPAELFGVFKAMIEPLHDMHTFIAGASSNQYFRGRREDAEPISNGIAKVIQAGYLRDKLQTWCNGRLSWGRLPDNLGYLRISAFSSYTPEGAFDKDLAALEEALDAIFSDAQALSGLVIDVRVNLGGSDMLGVAVASRLAPHDYLAFTKKARNDPADASRFTDPQATWVRVSDRPHFHGKVVLLTGGNTISAGETFTMALMGRKPPVTRIGRNTQGVFSDQLSRQLPNGFRFALPNEVFLTEDGQVFEGAGIPPHVLMAAFSKEDLDSGRDPTLDRAIAILQAN